MKAARIFAIVLVLTLISTIAYAATWAAMIRKDYDQLDLVSTWQWNDAGVLQLGTGADVTLQFDGTNFEITGATENTPMTLLNLALSGQQKVLENVTVDDALTTAESGKMFIVDGNTVEVKLTLPSVGATDEGVYFIIVDANETAASDVSLTSSDSDTINGSGDDYTSDGADEVPCAVTVTYNHDNTDWVCEPAQLTTAWDTD